MALVSEPPDDRAALLAASVGGDQAAFERLVDLHKNLVWAVIRAHRLRDRDAEDVFQVVFIRFYERQATIRDPARLGPWLATTTRRECYAVFDRSRREVAASAVDDLVEDTGPDEVDQRLLRDEQRSALAVAYLSLPERCRALLRIMAAEPRVSYAEMAAALGVPRGSLGPTRRRCIEKLRDHPAVRRTSGGPA